MERLRARYDHLRGKLEPLVADPGVASMNADRVDRLRAQLAREWVAGPGNIHASCCSQWRCWV